MTRVVSERAQELDAADPLAWARQRFAIPDPGLVYFDGNSLGRAPLQSRGDLLACWDERWASDLVEAWDEWQLLPRELGSLVESVIGARPGSVVVGDSTTINLHKAIGSALAMTAKTSVVVDRGDFPTDRFAAASWADRRGGVVHWMRPDEVIDGHLPADVGAAVFSMVDYRSGALASVRALAERLRAAGVALILDLSHAAGVVEIDIESVGAAFAVGCTYKYLCGGPGAPAFLYVGADVEGRADNPLPGWWGSAAPFDMDAEFVPAASSQRFVVGSPSVLSLVGARAGLALAADIGARSLQEKSERLTDFLIERIDTEIGFDDELSLLTPTDPADRGGHVSITHAHAWQVSCALRAANVIGDMREPNLLRLAPAPMSTSYAEVEEGVRRLAVILHTSSWAEFAESRDFTAPA